MCNLYSITTNQEAIRALFRVVNRTSATCRRCRACFQIIPRQLSATSALIANCPDALGHAATAEGRRAADHQHQERP